MILNLAVQRLKYLDLTLETPAANLALEEAMLEACDQGAAPEVLRFWEPDRYFVVAGYANHLAREVKLEECRRDQVPVYRRCSGGGTVLQGPGCLNYSLVLSLNNDRALETIPSANRHIMGCHGEALARALALPVRVEGITDLTLDGRKFSGNAQRRMRNALLFHGTFLLGMEMEKVERYLALPSRAPEYRLGRPHSQFLTNLPARASSIRAVLRRTWGAEEILREIPKWNESKYTSQEWIYAR